MDLYASVTYEEYKELERRLRCPFEELERVHVSAPDQFYHKSIRLPLGPITLEIHGPVVKGAKSSRE